MKNQLIISILVIAGIVAVSSQGCKKDEIPDTEEFIIQVDSIVHADTIDVLDPFEVQFYGKIGDNECFQFSRYYPAYSTNLITVSLIGLETIKNDCAGDTVWLDGQGVGFTDMSPGNWTIKVLQPNDEAPIMSGVFVR